jgi:hypothetical protein
LGSFVPPAELVRRDSGDFEEMKHLFSIAPKDGRSSEVTEQVYAEKHVTDAHDARDRCGCAAFCRLTLAARREAVWSGATDAWTFMRQTLTSTYVAYA